MKSVMQWIKNIKWLFDYPPTNLTSEIRPGTKCEFCGAENSIFYYEAAEFCICQHCIAKAFRKVLKGKNGPKSDI